MQHQYTHIRRLFYFDAEIPSDVKEISLKAGEAEVKARKIFWRFYWLV